LIERARDQGTTVVLVTHDMEEAERLCDRVAVLHDGRLLTCGRPVELVTATGTVHVRFSSPAAAPLEGLARVPGVAEIGFDGAVADVTVDPRAVVHVAAELARRNLPATDFTVIRPSLEDAVVSLLNGGSR
jgi:ABC-2 type transport system ATP-binding protein